MSLLCSVAISSVFVALGAEDHTMGGSRADMVAAVNAAPGVRWRAAEQRRFRGAAPGASQSLCGVAPDSREHMLAAVASGAARLQPQWEGRASELLEAFDAEAAWPHCADIIGDIRDQSNCGCCWAFGAAEAASDRMCIATNGSIRVSLSAEDACFCAQANGCGGSTLYTGWSYLQRSGLVSGGGNNGSGYAPSGDGPFCAEYSLPQCHHHGPEGHGGDPFPAENTQGCPAVTTSPQCPTSCDARAAGGAHGDFASDKFTFQGQVYMYPHDEASIRAAILADGPVEAAFTVYEDFENYESGVYHHVTGRSLGGHAVRIVGWGTDPAGGDYWKVANSWNKYWGEKGYFRIARGVNEGYIEDQITASSPGATWGKMAGAVV